MKVLRDGKEVKNANVIYFEGGQVSHVEVDGVNYDPSAFKFEGSKTAKKTKDVKESGVLTTKSVKRTK